LSKFGESRISLLGEDTVEAGEEIPSVRKRGCYSYALSSAAEEDCGTVEEEKLLR